MLNKRLCALTVILCMYSYPVRGQMASSLAINELLGQPRHTELLALASNYPGDYYLAALDHLAYYPQEIAQNHADKTLISFLEPTKMPPIVLASASPSISYHQPSALVALADPKDQLVSVVYHPAVVAALTPAPQPSEPVKPLSNQVASAGALFGAVDYKRQAQGSRDVFGNYMDSDGQLPVINYLAQTLLSDNDSSVETPKKPLLDFILDGLFGPPDPVFESPRLTPQEVALAEAEERQKQEQAKAETERREIEEAIAIANREPVQPLPSVADRNQVAQASAPSDEYVFNVGLIPGLSNVNLDELLNGGVLEGTYNVTIFVNSRPVFNRAIDFKRNPRINLVEACIGVDILSDIQVDVERLISEKKIDPNQDLSCLDLPLIMDLASQTYNAEKFRLYLSIPQAYFLKDTKVYPNPSEWDYGVTAFTSRYGVSYGRTWNNDTHQTQDSISGTFSNRLNVLGWRIHNQSSAFYNRQSGFDSNSFTSYAEHDVDRLKAQFRIGNLYASSSNLGGVGIRGIQLSDDLGMQPYIEARPQLIIRGIAQTNARVEVRQNGFLIYTTNVSPGMFALDEVQPVSADSDFIVTVLEEDGRQVVTRVPYLGGSNLLKQGYFTYDLTLGRYHPHEGSPPSRLNVLSFNYNYGLLDTVSVNGGVQLANHYMGLTSSIETLTPIGPVSFDVSASRSSNTAGGDHNGFGLGMRYNKNFDRYGLTFMMASQHYTSSGFMTLDEHARLYDLSPDQLDNVYRSHPKFTNSISINKTFEDRRFGSLYANIIHSSYWDSEETSSSVSAMYTNSFRKFTYTLGTTYTRHAGVSSQEGQNSLMYSMFINVPLFSFRGGPVTVSTNYDNTSGFSTSQNASKYWNDRVNGQPISYGLYASSTHRRFNSMGGSVRAQLNPANVNASATYNTRYTTFNSSISGTVIAHAGGLNFTRMSGDEFVLVKVPGQSGVSVNNGVTGWNGYAVTTASPYQYNNLIVGKNLDPNVEIIQEAGITIVPRRGAIARTEFEVRTGRRVEFTIRDINNELIPLGGFVQDEQGQRLGVLDPFGRAMVLVPADQGSLVVNWDNRTCSFDYSLGEKNPDLYYENQDVVCIQVPTKKEQP